MIRPAENKPPDSRFILGSDGPIADILSGYESRSQQIEMAGAIGRAFRQQKHLVVEAGTGVGKSFAYLIPSILFSLESKQKVVISTYTIALQEQLIYKDIPFLKKVMPSKFTAVLAKGRGNYLCLRRLEQSRKRQATLFEKNEDIDLLASLFDWALATNDGSLSDLGFTPPAGVWEHISSDAGTCAGRRCPRFGDCFYQKARKTLFHADIIIANHALLFSDLALRIDGGSILPAFKAVVLDEAHNVETVAGKHFGLRVSNAQIRFLLNHIYNPKTEKGILAPYHDNHKTKLIRQAQKASDHFFDEVIHFFEAQRERDGNGRVTQPNTFANVLAGPLTDLSGHLRRTAGKLDDEQQHQEQMELRSYADRCNAFVDTLNIFTEHKHPDDVYWVEASPRRFHPFVVVNAAPLHVGPAMKKSLFDQVHPVILTSATLSIRNRKHDHDTNNTHQGFEFFCSRLGLDDYQPLLLGSPFDYESQVTIYVESTLPEPGLGDAVFIPAAVQAAQKYLEMTSGKAFILFTSFKHLQLVAQSLQHFCNQHGFMLLEQGRGKDRTQLLNEFRQNTNSVLLGTDSFWQGVDVPGESLSNVIIFKLPFAVPDEPLLQARLEHIKKEGGSGFFDYQLPQAILKFKQGFGRLIRTKTDRGIVVILDPRVVTKNYGQAFLAALPDCPIRITGNHE